VAGLRVRPQTVVLLKAQGESYCRGVGRRR
jgi:hypothetical protein